MAGIRTVEELLKRAPDAYEVHVFGREPYPNYDRIKLSSVLAGDAGIDEIVLNDWDWYQANGINLYAGEAAVAIDIHTRKVSGASGRVVDYDELILATGSDPLILPVPGHDRPGVIAFRDIQDCQMMMETARHYRKAVVIGGGLLGLEAARGLLNLSMEVAVVHLLPDLMERQLDPAGGRMLKRELERQGMRFLMPRRTAEIVGDTRVTGVRFDDGTVEPCDLVVMAVGIRPNVRLARESGLEVNRGIVVDDYLATSAPGVSAVGECAEHRGQVYGLVAPLFEQAAVLARRLAGIGGEPYTGSVTSTKLKVSGVSVFSGGQFEDGPDRLAVRVEDEVKGIYKKIVFENGRLVGAVLFGDTGDSTRLVSLLRQGATVEECDRAGVLTATGAGDGDDGVAAWPAEEIVCGCMGVSKGRIVEAIEAAGLSSADEVKAATGASRSCGGCRSLVTQLVGLVTGQAGGDERVAICGCTTRTRDEVVAAIRDLHLLTAAEVMNVLDWTTPEGCSKCRPALNYYLGMVWPQEYRDDRRSRLVNERVHANIQRDGTFSVVPRIYGGVTSPAELRRIADVAEKYQVPMVKITGGQRIDLLGLRKADLPAVWADLGMPSGYAYSKAFRTVKTCVGTDFCRYGTQNSIQMGIDMERQFEGLNTPHKVKMAVSGCPRNCAESTIKDVGVIGVEGGWDVFVGGNGGVKVRESELLCRVKTADEVLLVTAAFLQYYRENANYLERTAGFVERIGIEAVRAVVNDPAQRRELAQRLEQTLQSHQDPWRQVVSSDEERREYEFIQIE